MGEDLLATKVANTRRIIDRFVLEKAIKTPGLSQQSLAYLSTRLYAQLLDHIVNSL